MDWLDGSVIVLALILADWVLVAYIGWVWGRRPSRDSRYNENFERQVRS